MTDRAALPDGRKAGAEAMTAAVGVTMKFRSKRLMRRFFHSYKRPCLSAVQLFAWVAEGAALAALSLIVGHFI
ncbi:hypothetical protein Aam_030_043 [Acidocella aminolytica 101 = DSM 11237]|uniref:Uncharacterized protein n=1 Tax=Acidocella aminolytica 101 = DSM 11237 TaxID=1120923 RepID=A0A0D6PDH7_9PROT|nr:hypothetical protein Aam_030_043 [Acidocella aminolytica 101 = DSM 11237]